MEKYTCFWQRSLTAKQLLHGAKGRELQTLTLSRFLGDSSSVGPLGARDCKNRFRNPKIAKIDFGKSRFEFGAIRAIVAVPVSMCVTFHFGIQLVKNAPGIPKLLPPTEQCVVPIGPPVAPNYGALDFPTFIPGLATSMAS